MRVLLSNDESIEHSVGPRVTTVTVYRYPAAGDVHNAEVIGFGVIVHVPGGFDGRIDGAAVRAGAAGAIEKLNHIVLPGGGRRCGLWIREDAAVNGPAGIEMRMSTGVEVELVGVKESP